MTSVSSPILVGRDRELAEIDRAFAAAASASPSIVVVGGEAGIGKSRLVAEAGDRAAAGGGRVIAGACLDLADGLPYLPFVEAVRRFVATAPPADLDAAFGPARREFARLMPELQLVAATPDDEEPISQGRLFELGLGMIGRLGAIAPVFLTVEDVQWIDRSSRDLITFLARNLSGERLVLVLTLRTDNLPAGHPTLAWLAELARLPRVVRLELEPLSHHALRTLLGAILGERPPMDLVDEVWRRSEGNPFFAEELLATRDAERRDGPPPTLAQILAARLARLSPAARELLPWLAIAGRPVDEDVLAAVTGRPPAELAGSLREGLDNHVLVRMPADGASAIGFRHALVAEVALADLLAAQRRLIHARFAEELAAAGELPGRTRAGAAGELAYHWTAAERWPEAYAAAIAAADAAESVAAHAQAVDQFEHALAVAPRLDPAPPRANLVRLLRRAADAADRAGDLDRALRLAGDARSALAGAEDEAPGADRAELDRRIGELAARAARGRAERSMDAGDPERALAVVEGALEPAAGGDVATVARLVLVGLQAVAELAESARASRDRARLAGLVRRAEALRALVGRLRASDPGHAVVRAADAEFHRFLGEPADWAGVAAALDRAADPLGAAYARFRAAEQELRARGTRADAEALLRSAFEAAERLGTRSLVSDIEALAQRARIPLRVAAVGGRDTRGEAPSDGDPASAGGNGHAALRKAGLSSREIEVLELVAAGRTNGEIAERLFITRKTAGVHVTHILDKLAVSNRVEAAMVAARLGLAPADDEGR